ncbi:MAG: hypothetical protein E6Q83_05825 [Thiothrix sp.]|nr:MAG: hypothetical protein E6Q83_05825 [Thiothrix sp.]
MHPDKKNYQTWHYRQFLYPV